MPGVLDNAHVAGLFINAFCGLGVGIENVLAPATNIDLLLDAFNRHPFDVLLTVPTVLTRMLAHPQFHQVNLSHLRFVCTGAAPTPEDTQQAFSKALAPGTFCQMAWGMDRTNISRDDARSGRLRPVEQHWQAASWKRY